MGTKEDIQANINSRLISTPTKIEGGTIQDLIGSVSYELANILDTKLDVILDNAFVKTADEEHLILKGEELGLYKKNGTNSKVIAKITKANPNFLITNEIKAKTDDNLIFKVVDEIYTDNNGSALVVMKCLEKGSIGNIEKGFLTNFIQTYQGLEDAEITNEENGYGGYNSENIEEFRSRILEYLKDDTVNSNISDYIFWAKSVEGVKNAVVKDATVVGAGSVYVYISSTDNNEPTDDLLEKVRLKIEKEQIINAKLEVLPLKSFEINVNALIKINDPIKLDEIKNDFVDILQNYLNTAPNLISYLYISNLLFENSNIIDVKEYYLNDKKESIEIDELFNPVVGNIEFTLIEE